MDLSQSYSEDEKITQKMWWEAYTMRAPKWRCVWRRYEMLSVLNRIAQAKRQSL